MASGVDVTLLAGGGVAERTGNEMTWHDDERWRIWLPAVFTTRLGV